MSGDPHLRVEPYNREYPKIFEEIRLWILQVVPFEVEVEHVGSTAIAGLGGREIIDVLILADRKHLRKIAHLLEVKGFRMNPQSNLEEKIFVSGPFNYKNKKFHVHIHITFFGSKEHREKIMFRDYLKRHSDEARRYYKLKKEWMKKARKNISKYGELKSSFIIEILKKAKEEAKS